MKKTTFSDFYTTSEYTIKNPGYHEKDSYHKWKNFEKCLNKGSKIKKISLSSINSVCEIGCGTGGILQQLNKSKILTNIKNIEGWDINPSAIKLATKKYPEIKFFNKDLLVNENFYDLTICADVFEHLENPYSFLMDLSNKSKYFLFNIPLELNLLSMLQGKKIFKKAYESVGHLHFYSSATANLLIELTGYEIIYQKYANNRTKTFFSSPSLKKGIAIFPQFLIEKISPYLSTVLMGDHLVILAKKRNN